MSNWYLYVVRCADDSLYTGISTDPERRIVEHNSSDRGARYTRARRPVVLAAAWSVGDRSAASSAEARFKRLQKSRKSLLLSCDQGQLMKELGLSSEE